MRKILILAGVAGILLSSCSSYSDIARHEYRTQADHYRINKENHKQRKKIYRKSRKANKERSYNVNSLGNVFKGL